MEFILDEEGKVIDVVFNDDDFQDDFLRLQDDPEEVEDEEG